MSRAIPEDLSLEGATAKRRALGRTSVPPSQKAFVTIKEAGLAPETRTKIELISKDMGVTVSEVVVALLRFGSDRDLRRLIATGLREAAESVQPGEASP